MDCPHVLAEADPAVKVISRGRAPPNPGPSSRQTVL
jgi:hypothetical protein